MSTLVERLRGFETHILTELASRFYILELDTDLSVKIRGLAENGAPIYDGNWVLKGIMLENPNGGLKRTVEACFAQFGLSAEPKPCDILTEDVIGMHVYYEITDAPAETSLISNQIPKTI